MGCVTLPPLLYTWGIGVPERGRKVFQVTQVEPDSAQSSFHPALCLHPFPPGPHPRFLFMGGRRLGLHANHSNLSCTHFLVLSQWGLPSGASGWTTQREKGSQTSSRQCGRGHESLPREGAWSSLVAMESQGNTGDSKDHRVRPSCPKIPSVFTTSLQAFALAIHL